MTDQDKARINREIAEFVFGRSLDGFGIFSKDGLRLRERDFDSNEDAQRYIDSEDERIFAAQYKAAAHGVNIRPCVKTHPDFFTDESANAMIRRKAKLQLMIGHHYINGVLQDEDEYWFCGPRNLVSARNLDIRALAFDIDDKTAVVLAFAALMNGGAE